MTAGGNQRLDMVGCYKVGEGGAPELRAKCRGSGAAVQQVRVVVVVVEG